MSRHRFVRNMSRSYDEVDAYDHFGGHSYEDAMSPSASEFVYQRTPSASLGDFLPSSNTEESMIETETEPRAAFDPSTLSEEQQGARKKSAFSCQRLMILFLICIGDGGIALSRLHSL